MPACNQNQTQATTLQATTVNFFSHHVDNKTEFNIVIDCTVYEWGNLEQHYCTVPIDGWFLSDILRAIQKGGCGGHKITFWTEENMSFTKILVIVLILRDILGQVLYKIQWIHFFTKLLDWTVGSQINVSRSEVGGKCTHP